MKKDLADQIRKSNNRESLIVGITPEFFSLYLSKRIFKANGAKLC